MRRFLQIFAFAALVIAPALTQTHAPAVAKKPAAKLTVHEKQVRALLLESDALGRDFPTELRLDQLASLCSAVTETANTRDTGVYAPELRRWSEEEFRLASEMPESDPRKAHAMSDAAMTMSRVNTSRALEMLEAIPRPAENAMDYRAEAASVVFRVMLQQQSLAALPRIRRTAASIGDSGSYPYGAMMLILVQLHNSRPDLIQPLFADALSYYERGDVDFASEMQFMGMLQFTANNASAAQPMLVEAAREVASHVVRIAEVESSDDTHVSSLTPMLSHRAENVLAKIDPAIAKELRERLAATAVNSQSGQQFSPPTNSSSERDILTRPTRRRFPPQAADSQEAMLDRVMSLAEDGKANTPEMKELIASAFETGAHNLEADLRREDNNEHLAKRNAGGLQLFVSYVAKFAPTLVLAEINSIQDDEVKAFLLIEAARAIRETTGDETPRSAPRRVSPVQ